MTTEQVRSGPSPIHGTGCFAVTGIPSGDRIGTFTGIPVEEDGDHVLWATEDGVTWTGREGTGVLRYLNHSATPNAEFVGFELYAVADVAPGEEITIDYQP